MPASTNSLERALLMLEVIEQTPGGLTNSEIRERLKIPKSTCAYITTRLRDRGFLDQDTETGRHRIGLTAVALAYGALRELGLRTMAEPALYRLAAETGLSVSLGVLERGYVLLVDRIEGPRFMRDTADLSDRLVAKRTTRSRFRQRAQRDIGRELPAHSNALGKVLLAYLPKVEVETIVQDRGLVQCTPKTIVSKQKLFLELDTVRRQGFAESDEEQYLNVKAIGAPVLSVPGKVRAAISVTGDPADSIWNDMEYLVKLVQAAAREIARDARR